LLDLCDSTESLGFRLGLLAPAFDLFE